jgi:hypothetical protein
MGLRRPDIFICCEQQARLRPAAASVGPNKHLTAPTKSYMGHPAWLYANEFIETGS